MVFLHRRGVVLWRSQSRSRRRFSLSEASPEPPIVNGDFRSPTFLFGGAVTLDQAHIRVIHAAVMNTRLAMMASCLRSRCGRDAHASGGSVHLREEIADRCARCSCAL